MNKDFKKGFLIGLGALTVIGKTNAASSGSKRFFIQSSFDLVILGFSSLFLDTFLPKIALSINIKKNFVT